MVVLGEGVFLLFHWPTGCSKILRPLGFTFTLPMPKVRYSAWFLVAASLCWLLLLLSTLSRGQPIAGLPAYWPRWLLLLAQGGFAVSIFLYVRVQPNALGGKTLLGCCATYFGGAWP